MKQTEERLRQVRDTMRFLLHGVQQDSPTAFMQVQEMLLTWILDGHDSCEGIIAAMMREAAELNAAAQN